MSSARGPWLHLGRRRAPPRGRYVLDLDAPICQGLTGCWPMMAPYATTARIANIAPGASRYHGVAGDASKIEFVTQLMRGGAVRGTRFANTSSTHAGYYSVPNSTDGQYCPPVGADLSFSMWLRPISIPDNTRSGLIGKDANFNVNGWGAYLNSVSGSPRLRVYTGEWSSGATPEYSLTYGALYRIGGVIREVAGSGSAAYAYVDGIQVGFDNSAHNISDTSDPLYIGHINGGARVSDAVMYDLLIWDRMLTDAERERDFSDPWSHYYELDRTLWFLPPAAVGSDITLTQSASETLALAEQGGTLALSMPLAQAASEALVLAEQQGTLSLSIPLAQGSPEALTLTENGGILALSMPLVQSAPEALVITENGGTLTVGSDIALAQAAPETLVLAEQGGVLGLSMPLAQAAPEALTITEHGGLLSLGTPINLTQSAPEALVIAEQGGTLSLSIPLVQAAPEALAITEHGGTVHLSGGIDVRDGSRHGGGIPISDERHPYWRNRIEVEDEPAPEAPKRKRARRTSPDHAEQGSPTDDHLARAATPGAEVVKALLGVPLPATEKPQARTSGAPPAVALSAPPARPDAASDALSREQRLIEELLLLELID